MRVRSCSSLDTSCVAVALARAVCGLPSQSTGSATVVYLSGTLGAGKSVFARAFIYEWLRIYGLTPPQSVPSPSFSIVNEYGGVSTSSTARVLAGTSIRLVHADLYRIESPEELLNIGFNEYLNQSDVCLVEWPEKAPAESGLLTRDVAHSTHVKILCTKSDASEHREIQMELPQPWQQHLKNEISELLF